MYKLNLEEMKSSIVAELHAKAAHVIGSVKTSIQEMKDAPDQQIYPLTRDEVARLLASWERHSDEDDGSHMSGLSRDYEGMLRVSEYPPEVESDYLPDHPEDAIDGVTRPAGLMPYDFDCAIIPDTDMGMEEDDDRDWSGADNTTNESVDLVNAAHSDSASAEDVVRHAIAVGGDVEVVLGDGNTVYLDPHTAQAMLNIGMNRALASCGSIAAFGNFLATTYSSGSYEPESAGDSGEGGE